MTSSVDAILLCGGKGVRLRPLTESLPKPLVPIKGKPILAHILSHLSSSPIKHYYIAAGYEINKIHEYFSSYPLKKKKVTIVDTGEAEIIERIWSCAKLIKGDGFLVLYGDTLADINIKQLLQFHLNIMALLPLLCGLCEVLLVLWKLGGKGVLSRIWRSRYLINGSILVSFISLQN